MSRNVYNLKSALILLTLALAATSCLKDPVTPIGPTTEAARMRLEITDAPIDDANVTGVFITVAGVEIDGKAWEGFDGKTTFDLLAYQRGETKLLGEGELDADSYSEVVLILDTETDANGDIPGCYVKDADGNKKKLNGGSAMDIKVKGNFTTVADATTEAVIDFDLRKAIVYKNGSTTDFQFVTDPELQASARLMDKAQTGAIAGDVTDGVSGSDKVIVYAYKKGQFDAATEKFPQGTSQIQFKNAITSSVVAEDGTFDLAFLETETYELHFISYQLDANNKLQAKGELQMNLLDSTLNLLGLNVATDGNIDIDLVVTGILFF